MARIDGVARPHGLFQRIVFWMVKRRFGRVMTPLRIVALNRKVFAAYAGLERHLDGARTLPASLKTMMHVRVAQMVGCPF